MPCQISWEVTTQHPLQIFLQGLRDFRPAMVVNQAQAVDPNCKSPHQVINRFQHHVPQTTEEAPHQVDPVGLELKSYQFLYIRLIPSISEKKNSMTLYSIDPLISNESWCDISRLILYFVFLLSSHHFG